MKWLAECSAAALTEALHAVPPELSRHPVTVPEPAGTDPQYHKASSIVDERFIVKFAWLAWHVRTALYDVLWRSELGIPLADHRIPPNWIDDLAARSASTPERYHA